MIAVFFIELGMAGLPGFPALLAATLLPLLPSWLAAFGATAPAGSWRARCSAWAWALPSLLWPKHARAWRGIKGTHSASARLTALELLMLYGTLVYLVQPQISILLVPGIPHGWMERRCRSMDPTAMSITFFPALMATGKQVGGTMSRPNSACRNLLEQHLHLLHFCNLLTLEACAN